MESLKRPANQLEKFVCNSVLRKLSNIKQNQKEIDQYSKEPQDTLSK